MTVAAGQSVTGINIAVSPPQSSPPPNAENLGVAAMSGTASAYNTGDVIHRGATSRVVMFGPSLNGGMQVTMLGPAGISISDIISITATDKTPGISFIATVAQDAALGARTVVLQNSKDDVTTFTGGLEVVP
ncbi:MAG: hypothetical protein ACRD3E_02115 [Terriglobales bacterium]